MRARRRLLIAALPAVAAIAVAVAVTGRGAPADGTEVLAAASLAAVVGDIDPDARVRVAGSDQLAMQVESGIGADVFLSADPAIARRLHEAGHLGPPVAVAGNRLVVIVAAGNPGGVTRAQDLGRPGVRLVVGTPSVPIGAYTRRALNAMGLGDAAAANVVSEEPDVRGVMAKVALGEADAGIVYATEARAAGGRVTTLPIPDTAQPSITHTAATLTRSGDPSRGRDLIELLRSAEGRRALVAHGFTVPAP
jgi:molybdate transport system substrate-binding protein